jgi:hypothetical protein
MTTPAQRGTRQELNNTGEGQHRWIALAGQIEQNEKARKEERSRLPRGRVYEAAASGDNSIRTHNPHVEFGAEKFMMKSKFSLNSKSVFLVNLQVRNDVESH